MIFASTYRKILETKFEYGFIKRWSSEIVDRDNRKGIYLSFIRSAVEYGCHVQAMELSILYCGIRIAARLLANLLKIKLRHEKPVRFYLVVHFL